MPDVLVVIGIGGMSEAIARRLGSGKQVVLADFNEETLDRVAATLRADGFAVDALQVDVSSKPSVRALAEAAAALGDVRQVAHTAGLSPVQAPADAILHVDLAGVAFSLDAFGDVVADGGAGVVIASMAGTMAAGHLPTEMEAALAHTPSDDLLALPFLQAGAVPDAGAAYGIAKRANQLRVQAASLAWGTRGARVNSISPGVISTPMGQAELDGTSGAAMRAMVDGSGTKRLGTPSDIAEAASFLLGSSSSFITGTDLLVDGGVVAAVRSGAIALPTA
ncbi:SDR family oxidoreductase [Streptosporangium sp. NPDC001681]|uniref:SDR family oxidoreductase n=1 Tax=Streptosporangium sp. NPDC001681 TaxID=3154395 RepID=UPI00332CAE6F